MFSLRPDHAALLIVAEDLAAYVGPARLVRARGDEPFETTSGGVAAVEHPDPGEVVWCDDAGSPAGAGTGDSAPGRGSRTRPVPADGLAPLGVEGVEAAGAALADRLGQLSPGARFTSRVICR